MLRNFKAQVFGINDEWFLCNNCDPTFKHLPIDEICQETIHQVYLVPTGNKLQGPPFEAKTTPPGGGCTYIPAVQFEMGNCYGMTGLPKTVFVNGDIDQLRDLINGCCDGESELTRLEYTCPELEEIVPIAEEPVYCSYEIPGDLQYPVDLVGFNPTDCYPVYKNCVPDMGGSLLAQDILLNVPQRTNIQGIAGIQAVLSHFSADGTSTIEGNVITIKTYCTMPVMMIQSCAGLVEVAPTCSVIGQPSEVNLTKHNEDVSVSPLDNDGVTCSGVVSVVIDASELPAGITITEDSPGTFNIQTDGSVEEGLYVAPYTGYCDGAIISTGYIYINVGSACDGATVVLDSSEDTEADTVTFSGLTVTGDTVTAATVVARFSDGRDDIVYATTNGTDWTKDGVIETLPDAIQFNDSSVSVTYVLTSLTLAGGCSYVEGGEVPDGWTVQSPSYAGSDLLLKMNNGAKDLVCDDTPYVEYEGIVYDTRIPSEMSMMGAAIVAANPGVITSATFVSESCSWNIITVPGAEYPENILITNEGTATIVPMNDGTADLTCPLTEVVFGNTLYDLTDAGEIASLETAIAASNGDYLRATYLTDTCNIELAHINAAPANIQVDPFPVATITSFAGGSLDVAASVGDSIQILKNDVIVTPWEAISSPYAVLGAVQGDVIKIQVRFDAYPTVIDEDSITVT